STKRSSRRTPAWGRLSRTDSPGSQPRIVAVVPIRVVFAEDNYLVREGIRRLLERESDIELAAACEDLPSLLPAIDLEQPDVAQREHPPRLRYINSTSSAESVTGARHANRSHT